MSPQNLSPAFTCPFRGLDGDGGDNGGADLEMIGLVMEGVVMEGDGGSEGGWLPPPSPAALRPPWPSSRRPLPALLRAAAAASDPSLPCSACPGAGWGIPGTASPDPRVQGWERGIPNGSGAGQLPRPERRPECRARLSVTGFVRPELHGTAWDPFGFLGDDSLPVALETRSSSPPCAGRGPARGRVSETPRYPGIHRG